MRQIDNITPQEIETLWLKGMLAARIQPRRVTYDKQCLELAKSFISDSNAINLEKLSDELAQEIQRVIDDFMEERGLNT